ncbi:MAG: hypothetical protein EXS46_01360 [Candidatus Taylorbacteria bacterium]|nr:hypothetical protein [Candidatus Taylorbacteria bacterium]
MEKQPTRSFEPQEQFKDYQFGLIDPRSIPEAKVANEKLFENPYGVLGIEVTIPAYAEKCTLGNIDPQHSDGNVDLAAIEVAQTLEVPPSGASMVTVRADIDALGAMALLKHRASGGEVTSEMIARIQNIASSDKFARGGWPGKTDLPSKEQPWPKSGSASETESLAAIAARVMDFKAPLADRMKSVEEYLTTGTEPAGYREKVEAERADMAAALEKGAIKIEMFAGGNIAYVESSHRAGTSLGYSQAPVVVAFNPAFKQGPGEAYRKYTVCQYEGTWADLVAAKNELAQLEEGWGGSPNIIGSPQGKSSELSPEQVITIVKKHLKPRE